MRLRFLVASHIHLEWCVKCQTDQADQAWRFSPNLRASISLLPSKSSLASPESRSGSWSSWQFQWHSWKNYGTVLSPTPIVIITTLNCKTTIYKSWKEIKNIGPGPKNRSEITASLYLHENSRLHQQCHLVNMELHQPFQASSETLLHCQSRGVTEDTRNAVCTASSWQLFSGS